jgi:uncharacterized membrane protein YhaH (DUF805 family)
MNFGQAIKSGFSNYVNFSGRAIRSEYWYWVLFVILGEIVTLIIDYTLGAQITTRRRFCRVWRSRSGGFTISTAPAGGYSWC